MHKRKSNKEHQFRSDVLSPYFKGSYEKSYCSIVVVCIYNLEIEICSPNSYKFYIFYARLYFLQLPYLPIKSSGPERPITWSLFLLMDFVCNIDLLSLSMDHNFKKEFACISV